MMQAIFSRKKKTEAFVEKKERDCKENL